MLERVLGGSRPRLGVLAACLASMGCSGMAATPAGGGGVGGAPPAVGGAPPAVGGAPPASGSGGEAPISSGGSVATGGSAGAGGADSAPPKPVEWVPRAPVPSLRTEHAAAVVGDRIYVGGGFEDLTAFNAYMPETDEWVSLAPMPAGRHHYGITAYNGNVYVFAGARNATAWRYNVASNNWTDLANLPFERSSGMAVTLGEYMYYVGGAGTEPTVTQRYDPAADEWDTLAELSIARDHGGAVVLDEKIYAIGGRGGGNFLSTVEIYDPALDMWTPGPSMIHARSGFGTVVWKGYIVACGGEVRVNTTPIALDTCEALPPGANEWEEWPSLPKGMHGMAMASYKDRIFILGASVEGFAITPTTDVFELVFE